MSFQQSHNWVIFVMMISITWKDGLYIEMGPGMYLCPLRVYFMTIIATCFHCWHNLSWVCDVLLAESVSGFMSSQNDTVGCQGHHVHGGQTAKMGYKHGQICNICANIGCLALSHFVGIFLWLPQKLYRNCNEIWLVDVGILIQSYWQMNLILSWKFMYSDCQ